MKGKIEFTKNNLVALYQIIGGIFGIFLSYRLCRNIQEFNTLILTLIIIAFLLYAYSIICGILIFKNLVQGLRYSRINQFLQIFNFVIFGYGFQYISGLFIEIGIDLTNSFQLQLNFGTSTWQFMINQDSSVSVINFNLFALFLLIYIDKQIKQIENKRKDEEVNSIGRDFKTEQ